jgi:hypothetical protein
VERIPAMTILEIAVLVEQAGVGWAARQSFLVESLGLGVQALVTVSLIALSQLFLLHLTLLPTSRTLPPAANGLLPPCANYQPAINRISSPWGMRTVCRCGRPSSGDNYWEDSGGFGGDAALRRYTARKMRPMTTATAATKIAPMIEASADAPVARAMTR